MLGHKIICIRCLNDPYKNVSRISSLLICKIVIIQLLDFDKWHPLNGRVTIQAKK